MTQDTLNLDELERRALIRRKHCGYPEHEAQKHAPRTDAATG